MSLPETGSIEFAGHRLDLRGQQLWRGSVPVQLRPRAWQLLMQLLERAGELIPAERLIDALWPGVAVTTKALTNRIAELRIALGDVGDAPAIIETVPRRGYRFIAPVRNVANAGREGRAAPALAGQRTAELHRLHDLLASAGAGRRQIVLVGGEPGIGKTWLLDRFAACLTGDALLLGRGQCIGQSSERESFGPWLALLADLCAGPAAATVLPLLRRCAPSWWLQMPWLQQGDEAAVLRNELAGAAAGRMLREGCALVEALAQQHTVVVLLEDLHWADAASIDLLNYLRQGRAAARLMVLATWRPVDAQLHAHPLAGLAQTGGHGALPLHLLSLQPLDDDACGRLLQAHLGDDALAARLLPLVQRSAQGNPLVVLAQAQHLRSQGAWQTDWPVLPEAAASPDDAVVPGPLRHVVAARLAVLPDSERLLLQAASVVGPSFTPSLVAVALQAEPAPLALACQALASRQLFIRAQPDASAPDRHVFLHDAYRQALYDSVPLAERQQLHGRVARRIEQAAGAAWPEVAATLAGAYARAALPADAARMLERTAQVSLSRFDHRAAVQAMQAALQQLALAPADATVLQARLRLHLLRGNVLQMLRTGHPESAPTFAAAEALAHQVGDGRSRVRALLGLCLARVLEGRLGEAVAVSADLLRVAEAEQPGLAAAAHAYAGAAALAHGQFAAAQAHCERALGLPVDPEVPAFLDLPSLLLCNLGLALVEQGRHAAGLRHVDASLTRGRARAMQPHLLQSLYWAAEAYRLAGETTSAACLYQEAAVDAERAALDSFALAARFGLLACSPPRPGRSVEMAALLARRRALGECWNAAGFELALAQACLADGDRVACRAAVARGQALQGGDAGTRYQADLWRLAATLDALEKGVADVRRPCGGLGALAIEP